MSNRLQVSAIGYQLSVDGLGSLTTHDVRLTTRLAVWPSGRLLPDSSTARLLDSAMTPLLAMVRANLKMSLRNRAALFWNLAFPALFIVIFGVVFGRGPTVEFDVGVAGPESAFRDAVVADLQKSPTFVVSAGDEAEELQALADGKRGVVAVFDAAAAGSSE